MMNRTVLLFIFSILTFLVIYVPIIKLFSYFSLSYAWTFSLVSVLVFPSGFLMFSLKKNNLSSYVYQFATFWFASVLLVASSTIVVEISRLLFKFSFDFAGWLTVGLSFILIVASLIGARLWQVKKITISSSKIKEEVTVVQISDVHAHGLHTASQLKKVFDKAIALNPDVIVITGDLIDIPIELSSQTFEFLDDINIPIIYESGNHESYVGLDKVRSAVSNSSLTLLENNSQIVKDISIVSISDSTDKKQVEKVLPTIKRDKSKFQILLYHRPLGHAFASKDGIDLMLSGHTHSGQFFPVHFIVRIINKYPWNTHKIGNMILHVSAGSGAFTWPMRLGSTNEITKITLSPSN